MTVKLNFLLIQYFLYHCMEAMVRLLDDNLPGNRYLNDTRYRFTEKNFIGVKIRDAHHVLMDRYLTLMAAAPNLNFELKYYHFCVEISEILNLPDEALRPFGF